MKKFILLILISILLCGCSHSDSSNSDIPPDNSNVIVAGNNEEAAPSASKNSAELEQTKTPESKASSGDSGKATGENNSPRTNNDGLTISASPSPSSNTEKSTVSFTITDDTGKNLFFSDNVEIIEGESVLDVLIKIGKDNKIPIVYTGGKKNGYVEGINGLFEFDKGPESGWTYYVNDDFKLISSGACKLSSGDKVKWVYTKGI